MENELTIQVPRDPRDARRFLDYLSVELQAKGRFRSRGNLRDDGTYSETLTWEIGDVRNAADRMGSIRFDVVWQPNGQIMPIVASPVGEPLAPWRDEVHGIVAAALTATVDARTTRVFRRHTYAYIGQPLDGEYYIAGFRIAPALEETVGLGLEERVVYMEHHVEAIDALHAAGIARVEAERLASFLAVILDTGLYTTMAAEKRWVLIPDGDQLVSRRVQLGYHSSEPRLATIPAKGKNCKAGGYGPGSAEEQSFLDGRGGRLRCPQDTRGLFRLLGALKEPARQSFQNACALYRLSLVAGRQYPSVAMAYQLAAIDALLIDRQRSANSFGRFVNELVPEVSEAEAKDYFGRVRSAHFHGGAFPGGEFEQPPASWGIIGPDLLMRSNEQHFVRWLARTVLLRNLRRG